MPTYQYACTNADCGNRFELVQSFSDPSASECPVCGSPVRKVFSAVGVVFKGSGFYRTDSRAANGKSGESAPAKEPSKDSAGTKDSSAAKEPAAAKSSAASDSKSSTSSTSSASKAAAST